MNQSIIIMELVETARQTWSKLIFVGLILNKNAMPITTSGNGAVQYSIYKEFSPVVTSRLVMGSTSVDMAEGLGDIKQFIICYFFFFNGSQIIEGFLV